MEKKILYLFILTLSSSNLLATTLDQFISLGLEHNPSYLIKKNEVEQAKANLKSKYANFLPTLDGELSRSDSKIDEHTNRASVAKLNANLNLFNGGADKANLDIERYQIKIAEANLRRVEADVIYDIRNNYFGYLYAKELHRLLQDIEKRRSDQMNFISMRFEGGREDKGSYLQSKAKFERAKYETKQSERLMETSREKLIGALGISSAELKMGNEGLRQYAAVFSTQGMDQVESIIDETPEIKIADYQLEMAKKKITVARSSFSPTLALNSSMGKSGETFNEMNTSSASIGVVLKIPIFSGGSSVQEAKVAYLEKVNREYSIHKEKSDKRSTIMEKKNTLIDGRENLKIQEEFLSASKTRAEVATGQYQSGLIDYTNWDLIQSELIDNEKSMLSVINKSLLSKADLDKELGIGVLP